MTDNKSNDDTQAKEADEQDVEGHNMWIDPGTQRDLARNHSKDVERAARERNRNKEAKRS